MARWRTLLGAIGGAAIVCAAGCEGRIVGEVPLDPGVPEADAGAPPPPRDAGAPPPPRDAGAPPPRDAGAVPPPRDAGAVPPPIAQDAGAGLDSGALPSGDAGTPRDAGPIDPGAPPLARDVALVALAAFQGVKVELANESGPVSMRRSPLVADRDVLLRLYVRPEAGASPRTVRGEVIVAQGDRVVSVHAATTVVARETRDEDPSTAIDVRIPAAEVTTETRIAARLVDPAGEPAAGEHPARLPRDGSTLALGAQSDAGGLELVLVPVSWEADGSSRMPDTSDMQLRRIRDLLLALYPIAHLEIRLRDPVPFRRGLSWGDVDFGALNDMLMDVRAADRASARAYYYGLVRPTETFASYCRGGCTTGMSYVADSARDQWMRVGSGIGYGDAVSAWTLAHEIGHQYGRYHAPCGVYDADPRYPYRGGRIGVWGWDARTGRFLSPRDTADFMSYCDPEWISDYTWNAMFERTLAVQRLAAREYATRERLRRLRVRPEGAEWGGTLEMEAPHSREAASVRWLDARGAEIARAEAPAVSLSHSEERVVFLRDPPAGATHVRVLVAGMDRTIAW